MQASTFSLIWYIKNQESKIAPIEAMKHAGVIDVELHSFLSSAQVESE